MNKDIDQSIFEDMPVPKALAAMALPTILSQLITTVYNLADAFFIGKTNDPYKVAALSLAFVLHLFLTAIANLFGIGGGSLISRLLGKFEKESARHICAFSVYGALLLSLVYSAGVFMFMEPLLRIMGASNDTLPYAQQYAVWAIIVGGVPTVLSITAAHILRSVGYARQASLGIGLGGILNIILDPVFIYGFSLGVRGAALATIISQAISCIWVVSFLSGEKTILKIKKENLRLRANIILPCLALGLATFIMQASESVVTVCFNSSLLHYGGDIAVGAMTILTSVMQFAMLPLQGIAQGSQPIASYNYGAKNADRVKKTFRLLVITCLTYSTLLWAAVQIIPKVFVSIFTSDAKLVAFTAPMLKIYLGGLFLFGIQIACQITFTSLGKAVNSIIVAVMRKFVLLLPLIYIMPHVVSNPTIGVYMAEPIADIIAVLFTSVLFTFQFKKALAQIRNSNEM